MTDTGSDNFIERIRERLADRYEIARELLGGGMSRVFVAREIALDREVVIKFLPPEIAAEANRDRFRREIQMAARLSHPHIAPLFSAAEDGELLYYTMPFIRGESLRHSLAAGKRFTVHEVIEILRDVADALAYAHKAGIVHRDIKPANVLREGDHAVITDFGVAKAVSFAMGLDSRSSVATTTGVAIGTPAYMAPEQIAGDASADHRVDIYALGLLGYELLTGEAPFRQPSPQAQLAAQLTQAAPPIQVTRPDTPPVLAVLLARCLEKDAARRPPTAESVLEVLRAVSSASGGAQYTLPVSRSPLKMGIIAAAIVIAAGVTVFAVRPKGASQSDTARAALRPDTPAHAVPPPAPVAVSELTALQRDSLRRLSDANAKRDARLISLLRDSITNAVTKEIADSVAKVRETELASARARDSIARVQRMVNVNDAFRMIPGPGGMPPGVPNVRGFVTPEMFAARAQNLGPPRRVGVAIYSGTRNPQQLAAAVIVRDSLVNRLRSKSRFIVVPTDSITFALSKSRTIDSLRTWMKAEMWMTIYATGDNSADSTRWDITLRDFTAVSTFATRSAGGKRVLTADATDPRQLSTLMDMVMRELEEMDRAPRKETTAVTVKGG